MTCGATAEPPSPDSRYEVTWAQIERWSAIEAALKEHHKWQLEANGLFMFYTDPKDGRIECTDISLEYAESGMCERTVTALSKAPPNHTPQGGEEAGEGSG